MESSLESSIETSTTTGKLLSFAVPSYNSAGFMSKCIESLTPPEQYRDRVEILIVDDGSKDETLAIAQKYEAEYPGLIRAIHQENKGHGGAVNTGLANAAGTYFKVVDSDDWADSEAYPKVLDTLLALEEKQTPVDMFLTNFVYDKVSTGHQRRMLLSVLFPSDKIITWSSMKRNITGFEILMHSVIYRTQLLRDCHLQLPEHCFYVDNLYVYLPLPYVKTIYYLNETFYHYYIGRDGQSVEEETMVRRIDQQLRVNYLMVDGVDPWKVRNKHQRNYIFSYLEMITVISGMLAAVSKDPENKAKLDRLWEYIKNKDIRTYKKLRLSFLGNASRYHGKLGRAIFLAGYHLSQRVVGFN